MRIRRVDADKVIACQLQLTSFYWTDVPELRECRLAQYTGNHDEGVLFVLKRADERKVVPGRNYYWVKINNLLDMKYGTILKKYAVEVELCDELVPRCFNIQFRIDESHAQGWCCGVWHPTGFKGIKFDVVVDHRSRIGPAFVAPGLWEVEFGSMIQPIMDNHGVISVNPIRLHTR